MESVPIIFAKNAVIADAQSRGHGDVPQKSTPSLGRPVDRADVAGARQEIG